jgi:hypothetical protein
MLDVTVVVSPPRRWNQTPPFSGIISASQGLSIMNRMLTHIHLFNVPLPIYLDNDHDLHSQQKAKQIYEAQKKKEEMTEAESEELALRRRKIINFISLNCKYRKQVWHCKQLIHVFNSSFRFFNLRSCGGNAVHG